MSPFLRIFVVGFLIAPGSCVLPERSECRETAVIRGRVLWPKRDDRFRRNLDDNEAFPSAFVYVSKGTHGEFTAPSKAAKLCVTSDGFQPRLMGMVVGQGLDIVSNDAEEHRIHTMSQRNPSVQKTLPSRGVIQLRGAGTFSKEELITVKCDIHPEETAYCRVLSHPYFAVTKAQAESDGSAAEEKRPASATRCGVFEISGLPGGTYELTAWHPGFGIVKADVSLQRGETKNVSLEIGVKE